MKEIVDQKKKKMGEVRWKKKKTHRYGGGNHSFKNRIGLAGSTGPTVNQYIYRFGY